MSLYKLLSLLIFVGSFLVSCGLLTAPMKSTGQPADQPRPTLSPTTLLPDNTPVRAPVITLNPSNGGPGTVITVTGQFFPVGQTVRFFLGVAGGAVDQEPLDLTEVAEDGTLSGDFPLPLTWSDHRPITEPELVIVAASDNFGVTATASLSYYRQPQPALTLTPVADDAAKAQEASQLVSQLVRQQLGLDFDQVEVIYADQTEWPDSCLGLPRVGEECVGAATPGYIVSIQAGGQLYDYHIDETFSDVRLAYAPRPDIGEVVISWRQGGELCQTASVGLEGVAFGPCGTVLMWGQLLKEVGRPQELAEFSQTYASFEADTPAGEISFKGEGDTVATIAEQRMIAEWTQLVRLEAEAGRSGASWGLALAWRRQNNQPGFCDNLTIDLTGKVFASIALCDGGQATDLGAGRLTPAQLQQLYRWVDMFKAFEINQTGSPVYLILAGSGTTEAGLVDQELMLNFAAEIFTSLSNSPGQ